MTERVRYNFTYRVIYRPRVMANCNAFSDFLARAEMITLSRNDCKRARARVELHLHNIYVNGWKYARVNISEEVNCRVFITYPWAAARLVYTYSCCSNAVNYEHDVA